MQRRLVLIYKSGYRVRKEDRRAKKTPNNTIDGLDPAHLDDDRSQAGCDQSNGFLAADRLAQEEDGKDGDPDQHRPVDDA